MPRRPQKVNSDTQSERAIRIEKTSALPSNWKEQLDAFIHNQRTRIIVAVVLLTIAVLLAVAYISFFFTGDADQSLLDLTRAERRAQRLQIQNWLGLPGAALSRWLIDSTFGILSIIFIIMPTLYGLKLFNLFKGGGLRVLFNCTFWLI